MIIIGDLGSLEGTVVATIILTLLPEPLRFIGFPSSIVGPARQILYALILLLILIYKPKGFFGKIELEWDVKNWKSKKYFGGVRAVDDCSFEVKKGAITALIGPNGSGKTTVFNLISGILKADSGKIIFQDKEITNLSPKVISNLGISRMFQQSRLFHNLTVRENLLLAFDNEDTKFWKNFLNLNKITKEKEEKN